jgi:hypothetical protein
MLVAFPLGGDWTMVDACTTAVISGRATRDGRPLLWKNRDTSSTRNEVLLLTDEGFRAVAIVNAKEQRSIWMGVNEAGFCIENSLSTDLKDGQKHTGPGNGALMKLALQRCTSVADFQKLLVETNESGRRTAANFGVIDAQGGAALFETGPTRFVMFDANDPNVAPEGYIVRSNFATTAHDLPARPTPEQIEGIYSSQRYLRARALLAEAGAGNITLKYVLRQMTRDLACQDGTPFPGSVNRLGSPLPPTIPTGNTISRNTTVSAAVFAGVRPGEDSRLTTMWTILGDPKFSIAVPCWVEVEAVADPLTDPHGGELGEVARTLRDASLTVGSAEVSTTLLLGIWTDLWKLEDQAIADTQELLGRLQVETSACNSEQAAVASSSSVVASERASAPTTVKSPLLVREELTRLHRRIAEQAWDAMEQELQQAKEALLAQQPAPTKTRCWPIKKGTVQVAIYDHTTGTSNGPQNLMRILTTDAGFQCSRISPDEIRAGKLREFDVLIMPGGSGSGQAKKLQETGCDAVLEFVRGGGGYVGICAGSYLASSHYAWSLGLINARVWDRAHWARGTGVVTLHLTEGAESQLNAEDAKVKVFYGQGPLLVPGGDPQKPPYELLASYGTEIAEKGAAPNAMTGTHAIIRGAFGEGRVICFSPHPEKPQGPQELIAAGVRWAAPPNSATPD